MVNTTKDLENENWIRSNVPQLLWGRFRREAIADKIKRLKK